jgi:hypothetical protein
VYPPDRARGPVDTLAAMTAEFNWWLLLIGLVVGGGLTWLVLADTRRREQDLEEDELPEEAAWIEARMTEEGQPLPPETIERVVQLHRAYLAIAPPDDVPDEEWEVGQPERSAVEAWKPSDQAPEETPPPAPAKPDEGGIRHEVRGG